ncbi:MAG: hypothetical protein ABI744_04540 [Chloroflexota bacterium]
MTAPSYAAGARPWAPGSRPHTAPRRRLSRPERAGRRFNIVGAILAVILVTFLLGLTYLAQTVQLAATEYQIAQHQTQGEDLHRQIQTIETSVLHWGAESTVIDNAQALGLDQLPAGTRLIAR